MASSQSSYNAETVTVKEEATLLTLSPELRFMVYDYLIIGKGTVSVFSQHDIASEVDTTTINLLHVNRLIRREVQEFFYKSQTFEFRSAPALNKFAKNIGHYHTSIVKNIQLGDWLCRRKLQNFTNDITPAFQNFLSGVENLTIADPSVGRFCHRSLDDLTSYSHRANFVERFLDSPKLRPGLKTYAILCASERLAAGRTYLESDPIADTCLLFVPKDVNCPSTVEEVNPRWAMLNELYLQDTPPGLPLPYNPHRKILYTTCRELTIPDTAAMKAALAAAKATADEHDLILSNLESRTETNSVENPIILSDMTDEAYEDDKDKQDEERVIADSDEVDGD